MSNDIAVGVTAGLPVQGGVSKKPAHLIILEDNVGKKVKRFISNDRPELLNGFVSAKGIYSDASEEEISKTFAEMLTAAPRELVLEMMFPWHKICSIKSLVFKAK